MTTPDELCVCGSRNIVVACLFGRLSKHADDRCSVYRHYMSFAWEILDNIYTNGLIDLAAPVYQHTYNIRFVALNDILICHPYLFNAIVNSIFSNLCFVQAGTLPHWIEKKAHCKLSIFVGPIRSYCVAGLLWYEFYSIWISKRAYAHFIYSRAGIFR